MAWTVRWEKRAVKELRKLPPDVQRRIVGFTSSLREDPRRSGKPLHGPLKGLWSYRVGTYRIISQINDTTQSVAIARVGPRQGIY